MSDVLAAVAHPTRRRILAALRRGDRTVTQIAADFDVTRPAVSQHLRVLFDAGLVDERREGRHRYYGLRPEGFDRLGEALGEFWDVELTAVTAEAEAAADNQGEDPVTESIDYDLRIEAPPETVFALLTDENRLRRWQAVAARVDLRAGGAYRFTVVPGAYAAGEFVEIDPGRRLVYTWGWEAEGQDPDPGGSTITVELSPDDDGTRLRFRHDGLPSADVADQHREGWDHFLERLGRAAENGDAGPNPWAAGPDELDGVTAAEASWAVTQGVLRNLTASDRDLPSPCSGFTLHELIEHLDASLRLVAEAAGAECPDPVEAAPEDRIGAVAGACFEAWARRGAQGEVTFGGATVPAQVPVAILGLELLVHGWDVARATNQGFAVPDAVASFIDGEARDLIQPEYRGEGRGFAAEVDVSGDASPMDRLAAFTGRDPN